MSRGALSKRQVCRTPSGTRWAKEDAMVQIGAGVGRSVMAAVRSMAMAVMAVVTAELSCATTLVHEIQQQQHQAHPQQQQQHMYHVPSKASMMGSPC
ncbi:hypothetical protein PTSG_09676 [Salpingoeca rosetta]|uniref:Uncharacterized protein n=1 Tax=Salpingoeca rosetta (strain ATCC 50818 / BSB-021) TaxID=946362 RepID=F2ULN9_SALR5|nr:uncharacterized protein PTSG_09676 [Salpingoeca rosetta]EGD78038.1 hypothetical protein PTSG_09676 [Salpingoeca rosetta]|eukprot:XP_004990100.1 hypothetical protein PTSG_09676 [Salpingoeca rosetta]